MSDKLGDFHANDIADAMPRLTVQERCKLYRILELDMLSDIFEYTDSDNAAEYVKEMDVKKGAAISLTFTIITDFLNIFTFYMNIFIFLSSSFYTDAFSNTFYYTLRIFLIDFICFQIFSPWEDSDVFKQS